MSAMENNETPLQIIRFPSNDSWDSDFFAIAPSGMVLEDAVKLANAVICKKNQQYNETDDGTCDDGLSVEVSICAELASMGFGIGKSALVSQSTITWDGDHEFDAEQKSILAAYKAKKAISTVLSKTSKP